MISQSNLKEQNQFLRQKIAQYKQERQLGPGLRTQIQKFILQSKKNIKQMSQRSILDQQANNERLHEITQKYENVLKEQIILLTQNKSLSQRKDKQDQRFNSEVQKLTKDYENQICQFQKKVKINVKKIQEMGGTNIIKKLVKNDKFKAAMAERGCNIEGLQKQSQLQAVAQQVQQKQKLIQAAQLKSAAMDEQLQKMHELIDTMKQLMQNMQKQKQNILKQNTILQEKLSQSQELIGKLLGSGGFPQDQAQQGEDDQDEDANDQDEDANEYA